ncbi:MAG: cytochrome c3 family protein, partial [Proteobacteria bacterium]|nr:cytochrome c3 family protein [Pseudomonadota bacterium]
RGNQEGLPGILGKWAFPGVQCEECHGTGTRHAGSGGETPFSGTGNACRKCHSLEPESRIPMTGVFLAPYTEYNQLTASPHQGMECVECHDPHALKSNDPENVCRRCHADVAELFEGSFKDRIGLTCLDCHMPPAGIVAKGEPERFLGDLRSHLFRIDHHAPFPAPVGNTGETRFNPGHLPVEYSCIPCHHVFESRQWATGFGANIHNLRITVNTKIMRLQRGLTLAGILAALAAFLTGLMLRGFIRGGTDRKRTIGFHRVSAWITFSLGIFLALLCLYFHFPWMDPARLLHEGIFIIHPFAGLGLLLAYFGKIWVVRRLKKGWKVQGLVMGSVLFLLWVIQSLTIAF